MKGEMPSLDRFICGVHLLYAETIISVLKRKSGPNRDTTQPQLALRPDQLSYEKKTRDAVSRANPFAEDTACEFNIFGLPPPPLPAQKLVFCFW